jgi:hypothetical protein
MYFKYCYCLAVLPEPQHHNVDCPTLCSCNIYHLMIFLFICAYNVWVISSLFPKPFPYPPNPLATQQKLFFPYL